METLKESTQSLTAEQMETIHSVANNTPPHRALPVGVLVRVLPSTLPVNSTFNVMAHLAFRYNIELYFFTVKDFNLEDMTVNATLIEGNNSTPKTIPLPKIVYNDFDWNSTGSQEAQKIIRRESYFTQRGLTNTNSGQILDKQRVYDILLKDGRFKEYLIETHTLESFDQFLLLFEKYHHDVVVKPTNGYGGRDIYRVILNQGCDYLLTLRDGKLSFKNTDDENPGCGYIIIVGNNQKIFLKNTEELRDYYDKHFAQNQNKALFHGKNILQPYIVSRTKYGNPCDFRIFLARGAEGKFKAFYYARINRNINGITSNVIEGGGYVQAGYPFLRNEFGNDADMLLRKLMYLGKNLPDYFQSFFKQTFSQMAIDIGIQKIDDSYNIKFFELNVNGPFPRSIEIELAFTNLEYMQYLGKCLADGTLNKA